MKTKQFVLSSRDLFSIATAGLNPEQLEQFKIEYSRVLWSLPDVIEHSLDGFIFSTSVLTAIHRASEAINKLGPELEMLLSIAEQQNAKTRNFDPRLQNQREAVERSIPLDVGPSTGVNITPSQQTVPVKQAVIIRKQLRAHQLSGCGLYRYGCDGTCKRCATLFYSIPLSKCNGKHSGPPCIESGFYPHLNKATWFKLHALKSLPTQHVPRGIMANPLVHERGAILARIAKVKDRKTNWRPAELTAESSTGIDDLDGHEDPLPCSSQESRDGQMEIESTQQTSSAEAPVDPPEQECEQEVKKTSAKKRSKRKRTAASSETGSSPEAFTRHADVTDVALRKNLDDLFTIIERSKNRNTVGPAIVQYLRVCCANDVEVRLTPKDLKENAFPDLLE